jgi:hypothetical protein
VSDTRRNSNANLDALIGELPDGYTIEDAAGVARAVIAAVA